MSLTLFSDTEMRPNESVSQIRLSDTSDIDGNESDIYGDPVIPSSNQQPASRVFKSRVSGVSKSLSAFFMITADTESEGRKFLKVSLNAQIRN